MTKSLDMFIKWAEDHPEYVNEKPLKTESQAFYGLSSAMYWNEWFRTHAPLVTPTRHSARFAFTDLVPEN